MLRCLVGSLQLQDERHVVFLVVVDLGLQGHVATGVAEGNLDRGLFGNELVAHVAVFQAYRELVVLVVGPVPVGSVNGTSV